MTTKDPCNCQVLTPEAVAAYQTETKFCKVVKRLDDGRFAYGDEIKDSSTVERGVVCLKCGGKVKGASIVWEYYIFLPL